ncbi:MAG: hypothetical protein AAGI91_02690 [Bacteroidota bacterium]
MAASKPGVGVFTVETVFAFLGALLVFPLLIKMLIGVVKGVFRISLVRKLLLEGLIVGATTFLTKQGVLDKLFGQPGRRGDGLLKPDVK